jgi:hypothetical protein
MDKVTLTYNGETDGHTWQAAFYTPSASSSLLVISSSKASTTTSSSASTSTSPAPVKSSTNVGAIVGGVVGALAVIGATAFGVIFLLMRKRKNKNNPDAPTTATDGAAPTTGQPPYNAPDGGAAAGYYGQPDNKPGMQQASPYSQSPANLYGAAAQPKYDANAPYNDNRVSTLSEATHAPVPPYHPSAHIMYNQAPLEMDGSSAVQHNAQGQPIYEAPTNNK